MVTPIGCKGELPSKNFMKIPQLLCTFFFLVHLIFGLCPAFSKLAPRQSRDEAPTSKSLGAIASAAYLGVPRCSVSPPLPPRPVRSRSFRRLGLSFYSLPVSPHPVIIASLPHVVVSDSVPRGVRLRVFVSAVRSKRLIVVVTARVSMAYAMIGLTHVLYPPLLYCRCSCVCFSVSNHAGIPRQSRLSCSCLYCLRFLSLVILAPRQLKVMTCSTLILYTASLRLLGSLDIVRDFVVSFLLGDAHIEPFFSLCILY